MPDDNKNKDIPKQEKYPNLNRGGFERLPKEKLYEMQSRGRDKANKIRIQRKKTAELIEMILNLKVKDKRVQEGLKALGITRSDQTQHAVAILAALKKAQKGDIPANQFLRDSVGDKIPERFEISKGVSDVAREISEFLESDDDE